MLSSVVTPVITPILLIIVSAFVGYAVSVWQNRSRPWLSLLGFFGSSRRLMDAIDVPDQLSNLCEDSLVTDSIKTGPSQLGVIEKARDSVVEFLDSSKSSLTNFEICLGKIQNAHNDEILRPLCDLLGDSNIQQYLIAASRIKKIQIPPSDPELETSIRFAFVDTNDGSYMFDFAFANLLVGSELNSNPFRKEVVESIVPLVAKLEKAKLVTVFTKLLQMFRQEIDHCEQIRYQAESLLDNYSRWLSDFEIINIGPNPFLIYSEGSTLHITGKYIRSVVLPCDLLEVSTDGSIREVTGALCIAPGATQQLALVTRDVQKDMPMGGELRGAYESGKATAYISLMVLGRAFPLKKRVKSNSLQFKGRV